MNESIAVVFMCVDSRFYNTDGVFDDLVRQIKTQFDVHVIFPITKPGPEGRVMLGEHHLDAMADDAELLVKHKAVSQTIIIGHHKCAGHPVDFEARKSDIETARQKLENRLSVGCSNSGVLLPTDGSLWKLEVLTSTVRSTVAAE